MLGDQSSLFESVKRLHAYELYEDLLLFADLNLSDQQYRMEKMGEDAVAYVHFCIADAHFQLGNFPQCIRHYEHVLKLVSIVRRKEASNAHPHLLHPAEIRFRMHKALLREGKEADAIKCLEAVTKADVTPKILFALARLHTTQRKSLRGSSSTSAISAAPGTRVINHFKQLVKLVPEAMLSKSYLVSTNNMQLDENNNMQKLSAEAHDWLEAKRLEAQRKFADAAQVLNGVQNPSLRTVLEMARYYHLAGVKHKALANYQRAHSLDPQNSEGMDVFASLLCQSGNGSGGRELEQLVNKLALSNAQSSEMFVAYGYLAKLNRNVPEARQFASRAETLAPRGRQRCEALVLKAQLVLDTSKRTMRDLNLVLTDALLNDPLNIQCYEIYVKGCLQMKTCYAEALRMCDRSAKHLGDNPRMKFFKAKVLAEQQASDVNISEAIQLLEEVTTRAPFIGEAVMLLAQLYERTLAHEKGIAFLRRCRETVVPASAGIHAHIARFLGDFLAKTNRVEAAKAEYERAMNFSANFSSDQSVLSKAQIKVQMQALSDLPVGLTMTTLATTPELNTAFNSSSTSAVATGSTASSQLVTPANAVSTTQSSAASSTGRLAQRGAAPPPPAAPARRRAAPIAGGGDLRRFGGGVSSTRHAAHGTTTAQRAVAAAGLLSAAARGSGVGAHFGSLTSSSSSSLGGGFGSGVSRGLRQTPPPHRGGSGWAGSGTRRHFRSPNSPNFSLLTPPQLGLGRLEQQRNGGGEEMEAEAGEEDGESNTTNQVASDQGEDGEEGDGDGRSFLDEEDPDEEAEGGRRQRHRESEFDDDDNESEVHRPRSDRDGERDQDGGGDDDEMAGGGGRSSSSSSQRWRQRLVHRSSFSLRRRTPAVTYSSASATTNAGTPPTTSSGGSNQQQQSPSSFVTPEQDPALVAAVLSRGGHSSSINRPVAVRRRAAAAPQLAVSMQQEEREEAGEEDDDDVDDAMMMVVGSSDDEDDGESEEEGGDGEELPLDQD